MSRQGVNITSGVHTHTANEGSGDCVQVKSILFYRILYFI